MNELLWIDSQMPQGDIGAVISPAKCNVYLPFKRGLASFVSWTRLLLRWEDSLRIDSGNPLPGSIINNYKLRNERRHRCWEIKIDITDIFRKAINPGSCHTSGSASGQVRSDMEYEYCSGHEVCLAFPKIQQGHDCFERSMFASPHKSNHHPDSA